MGDGRPQATKRPNGPGGLEAAYFIAYAVKPASETSSAATQSMVESTRDGSGLGIRRRLARILRLAAPISPAIMETARAARLVVGSRNRLAASRTWLNVQKMAKK